MVFCCSSVGYFSSVFSSHLCQSCWVCRYRPSSLKMRISFAHHTRHRRQSQSQLLHSFTLSACLTQHSHGSMTNHFSHHHLASLTEQTCLKQHYFALNSCFKFAQNFLSHFQSLYYLCSGYTFCFDLPAF